MLKKVKSVPSTVATIASCARVSRPRSSATGMLAIAAARPRSLRIIVRRRSQRSTSAPAGNPRTVKGSARRAPSSPAWAGDPVIASISRGKASCETWVPSDDTTCPNHSSR